MITPKPQDARHKNQMFRLLITILKDNTLNNNLKFKGGTYASLCGVLDRFSIDLDFDLPTDVNKTDIRMLCHNIFKKLSFEIKDESTKHLQFFLKYKSQPYERNTLKLEINDNPSQFNTYEPVYLKEINMYCNAHTLDTMFANKLVAAKERFDKTGKIAGRDFYDIHKFFLEGLPINTKVIKDRTHLPYINYITELKTFIKDKVNQQSLVQDLNVLLMPGQIKGIDSLKQELITFLNDEIKRAKGMKSTK